MNRAGLVLCVFAISCHAPIDAIPSSETASADSAQSSRILITDDPEPAPPVYTAEVTQIPRETDASDGVSLCCDRPTGLCFVARECLTVSSYLRTCAPSAVRDVDRDADIVVCAD